MIEGIRNIMTTTLLCLGHFASLHRLRIAGLVAVLLVASGNVVFGQASKKSPPASNNAIRPASSPRVATNDSPDPKPETQAAPMTIERVNELTGFEPASEEEVKLLVEKMQRAIAEKDTSGLRECFDERRLTVRQFAGINVSEETIDECLRIDPAWRAFSSAVMQQDSNFAFIQTRGKDKSTQPLLRFLSKEAGLAYHEYLIEADLQDGPKVVDAFMHKSGNYLSLNGRFWTLGELVSSLNPNRIELSGVDQEIVDVADKIYELGVSDQSGHLVRTMSKLNQFPDSVHGRANFCFVKCILSRNISVEEFRKCAEETARLHPGATFSDLLLLDFYRVANLSVDQMEIAERLMKSFDDPFLHYYRVKGLVKAGRLDEARQAMDAAKRAAPTFVDVHVADVELLLIEGDQDRTVKAIESVESTFGDDVLNLASYEGFENFSQSPIGRKFLARRAGFEF